MPRAVTLEEAAAATVDDAATAAATAIVLILHANPVDLGLNKISAGPVGGKSKNRIWDSTIANDREQPSTSGSRAPGELEIYMRLSNLAYVAHRRASCRCAWRNPDAPVQMFIDRLEVNQRRRQCCNAQRPTAATVKRPDNGATLPHRQEYCWCCTCRGNPRVGKVGRGARGTLTRAAVLVNITAV